MSTTRDLFAQSVELTLPDRVRVLGTVLGTRIAQLDHAGARFNARLSRLNHSSVEGFIAEIDGRRPIAIVAKRTAAKLGVEEILVVPDGLSTSTIAQQLEAGRGGWLSPRRTGAASLSLEEAERAAASVVESWRDRFVFREERQDESGVLTDGLRSPQAGALHAVMAHWSVSRRPATIVMPTGTGKTETMLGLLVSQRMPRLMVIVPNDALRSQIADKFLRLGVLAACGCLTEGAQLPIVAMMRRIPKTPAEVDEVFRRANVVVTTMQVAGNAPVECQARMAELASHLFVDEAHHIRARTWSAFRAQFADRPVLQFTATPFRNDGRGIGGKFIYVYPLRKAQEDHLFRPITFVPVQGLDANETDDLIIEKIGEVLGRDRGLGLGHVAMARTDTILRAKALRAKYAARLPQYRPLLVHSEMRRSEREAVLRSLKAGASQIIVCVDMLGEGFDFPELKIAGLHDKHKSEAVTLQFIGRFTRSRRDLGDATVIANIAQGEIPDAMRKLYAEDADWDEVLSVIGTQRTLWEERRASIFEGFNDHIEGFPLQTLFPRMSAVAYRTTCESWRPHEAASAFKTGAIVEGPIVNESERLAIFVTRHEDRLRWATVKEPQNIEFNLYLVHWDEDRNLLFINSSRMQELHSQVARAVAGEDVERISGEVVFRVLSGYRRLVLANLGLSETQRRPVRYAMFIGSDIAEQLDALPGNRNRKKTNVFGQGYTDKGKATIGCSTKGKIWSYDATNNFGEWIDWCREAGTKLLDETITTDGILRKLVRPRRQQRRPAKPAIGIAWPEGLLLTPESRIEIEIGARRVPFFDCDIDLCGHDVSAPIRFRVGSTDASAEFEMTIDEQGARYVAICAGEVLIHQGRRSHTLIERFKEDPPHIYFADGDMLVDCELFELPHDEAREPFDPAKIEPIAWRGVDITRESQGPDRRPDSIQRFMIERLAGSGTYEVIYDDDGAGEVADIVAIRASGNTLMVDLVHCKFSTDATPGARVEDLYAVCGQSQKSVRWRERPDFFLKHLLKREADRQRAGGQSRYEYGSAASVTGWLNRWEEFNYVFSVTIAQPGLAKRKLEQSHLELLAATESFLMDTWGMRFRILASA